MLLRAGRVVTGDAVVSVDLRLAGGRIAEIGPDLPVDGDVVVDLEGLHVLPGAVDPHGHQWEPGFTPAPDFADVTASAAIGGVTTLLDHPLTTPVVVDRASFEAKLALGARSSIIDFGLHGGAAPDHLDDLGELWAAGATAIKLFTCPTGTPLDGFDDPELLRSAFERMAALGVLVLVHAEAADVMAANLTELEAAGGGRVDDFDAWHSLEAERTAVARVLALTAKTCARTYFVHASHPDVVDLVLAARGAGSTVNIETCPHYLHLTDADLRAQGGFAMTAPPVRSTTARDGLRRRLGTGEIDTVGSDHCAIGRPGKMADQMTAIIPGVPGLDLHLPLLLDLVAAGTIDLPTLARVTADNPARIFGLSTKGSIRIGLDADLAIVDLSATWTVRAADLPGSCGWSPYEERALHGRVVETWSRGERIQREGQLLGAPGRGRFIPRTEGRDGVE